MSRTLEDVATELYGGSLASFVQQRNALAKELKADDPDLAARVAKLPKPVASAHLVNTYARLRADDLEELLDLGAELREAQEERDGARVRALTQRAHEAVRRSLDEVRGLVEKAGAPLSAEGTSQVEQTLRAAMADEQAAAAVRSGLLAKPLAPAGFGPVDLAGAVAVTPSGAPARAPRARRAATPGQATGAADRRTEDKHAEQRAEVERAAQAALEKLRQAEARLAERDAALEEAIARHAAVREQVAQSEAALEQARAEEREAAKGERTARQERDAAARPITGLAEKAEHARQALDRVVARS